MGENGVPASPLDLRQFDENRSKYSLEQLFPYTGRHVAWSPDGKRILVAGETREEVDETLEKMGIQLSQVVHDYIDPPL